MATDRTLNFVSLFAGIGGIDLGLERAGMRCIAQVEINPFSRSVLASRWPDVRRFDDVRTFGRKSIDGEIDLVCGGFPCQDISNAGPRIGIYGERSGLWSEYRRIICELRPRFVLVENVAALLVRGIDRVLGDLAALGFDAEWSVLSACALGAPHTRERLFIVAYPASGGRFSASFEEACGRAQDDEGSGTLPTFEAGRRASAVGGRWWVREPKVARMVDGSAAEMDGPNRALGNMVVPQVAEWIGRRIVEAAGEGFRCAFRCAPLRKL